MIRFTLLFTGALLIFALIVSACIKRVSPDEIGIHISNKIFLLNSQGGLDRADYDAGFYRSIWGLESWDTLPRSAQRIAFTNRIDLRGPEDSPAIDAKTSEGDTLTIEATVLFRIAQGKGHLVYEKFGGGDRFRRLARDLAKPQIVTAFGTLKTQEIYDKEKRQAVYKKLESQALRESFEANNFELISVAIMEVSYDPQYEIQLQRKKVATQNELLAKSRTKLAEEEGKKKKIIQETDNEVQKLKIKLSNEKETRKADNDLAVAEIDAAGIREAGEIEREYQTYKGQKEAQGIEAKKSADAYAVQKQKEAYGENGANVVAYIAAKNFPVRSVTMPSFGLDWFNPMAIAQRMGQIVETAGGQH